MTETTDDDRSFPPALADVARAEYAYNLDDDGDVVGNSIDFEPYDAFYSAEEATDWLRNWTGNREVDGGAFRVFGQDGAGGLAAVWCARPGRPLAEQPVVFMGSEGERGVVAGSLSDFLWVLADGFGPAEAALSDDLGPRPDVALPGLAERHATTARRTAEEIVTEARAEFATFSGDLDALCR